jgi:hypothetical protein
MHRQIIGDECVGRLIDHREGNGLDNRRSNLRVCNKLENSVNRGTNKNNSSGYKGIIRTPKGRWQARIMISGTSFYLGTFDTPELAALEYDRVSVKEHGEFAYTNFKQQP